MISASALRTKVCEAFGCTDDAEGDGTLCSYHRQRQERSPRRPEISVRRIQLAVAAGELRRRGLKVREIAAELQISRSYAGSLLDDPTGEKIRARKASYGRPCVEGCGRTTSGSDGRDKAPLRCSSCSADLQHRERHWTREKVIEAIQLWASEHDGEPPAAPDWISRPAGDSRFPTVASVYRSRGNPGAPFATWNDAIRAAGFTPRSPSDRRTEAGHGGARVAAFTREGIVELLQADAKQRGRSPRESHWKAAAPGRPCAKTVLSRFGTWNRALEAAGLEIPPPQWSRDSRRVQELEEEVARLRRELEEARR